MSDYTIEQLINIQQVEQLLEAHVRISGIACGLMDNDQNIIIGAGLQQLCTQFLWENSQSFARCWRNDPEIKQALDSFGGDLFECRCKNGMINIAMPIVIEGNRLAIFFSGQFFYDDQPPDLDWFQQQAEELGFDLEPYLAAVRQVPLFSHAHVDTTMRFLHQLVQLLAETGHTNLQRQRELEERKQAAQQIKLLNYALDQVREGIFLKDLHKGQFLYVNQEACRSLEYSGDELLSMSALDINPSINPEMFEALGAELLKKGGLTFETTHQTKSGRVFPVEVATTIFTYGGTHYSFALVRDITERKRAESELSVREQQFRSLAEHIPDNVARWDAEGRFLYSNPVHQRTMGKPLEVLIGKTHDEIFPDGRYASSTATIVGVVTTGKPLLAMRQVIPGENGTTQIHDISFVPEFSEDGRVVSVLGLGRDMTDIYLLQETLDKRECEFRTLAENLPDNIVRYDSKCRAMYMNPEMERTLGRPATSIIGLTPIEDIGEEVREYQNCIELVLATGNAAEIDLFMPDHGEGVRHHNIRFVAERSADGSVSGVLAIGRDITERKRSEEALREREQQFRTLAENAPDNIARYDTDCRMVYVNPHLALTLGSPAADLLGKTPLGKSVAGEHNEYQDKIRQVLTTGEKAEIDVVLSDSGEGKRYHNVRFVAERGTDGNVSGVLAIGRDITERKRAEQERLANLYFLSCMERVNRAIQQSSNLEQMMSDVLDVVLSIFGSDRAYLLYPCDPDAKSWQIPMERTTAEYPGFKDLKLDASSNGWIAKKLRLLRYSIGPIRLGVGTPFSLSGEVVDRLGIKNIMAMALYPKLEQPWEFGIHQCSHQRNWSPAEKRLFQEIGRRLSDGITSLLIQRNLQASEARYRMVFENSPVSLWEEDFSGIKALFDQLKTEGVVDIETCFDQQPDLISYCAEQVKIVDINQAALTLHDAQDKQELLAGLIKTFTPESLATFRSELVALWQGKTQIQLDSVVKTLSGELRQVTVYAAICPGYESTLAKCLVSLVDVTEQKQAEQKLREKQQRLHDMALELTIAEGRERRRIAVDLHDTLGQDLTLSRMKLGGLAKTNLSSEQNKLLHEIKGLTEGAINRVRSLTKLLCPPVLDSAGLEAALKWLARQIETDYKLQISFNDDLQEKTVVRELQLELYSSVRELLINVAKHAGTETVCLSLSREADLLVISVEDDGVGFDVDAIQQNQGADGFGLFTIKRRILNMGGSFKIVSEPGNGAEVIIKVPLTSDQKREG